MSLKASGLSGYFYESFMLPVGIEQGFIADPFRVRFRHPPVWYSLEITGGFEGGMHGSGGGYVRDGDGGRKGDRAAIPEHFIGAVIRIRIQIE